MRCNQVVLFFGPMLYDLCVVHEWQYLRNVLNLAYKSNTLKHKDDDGDSGTDWRINVAFVLILIRCFHDFSDDGTQSMAISILHTSYVQPKKKSSSLFIFRIKIAIHFCEQLF